MKHTEEAKRKISLNHRKYQTEETKLKISKYRTGRKMSEEQKEKLRKATLKQMKEGRMPTKETKIERMMENKLLFNDISYVKQYHYKLGVADFWLPEYNIIIECDGDYWHSKPGAPEKDKRQTEWLEENDYTVYRFKGSEIENNIHKCFLRIGEFNETENI